MKTISSVSSALRVAESTFLRITSGLDRATSGRVLFRDREVLRPNTAIGMVFPQFSGMKKKERLKIAEHYLRIVGMTDFSRAFPHELSGGMRQRVAIARAFANNPEILLMDEPFGSLDAHTRILMQKELLRLREHNRKTIVFVTHSVDEAVYLGDRVIIMSARPARIRETLEVKMAHPRSRANPEFGKLTDHILSELEEEVMGIRR